MNIADVKEAYLEMVAERRKIVPDDRSMPTMAKHEIFPKELQPLNIPGKKNGYDPELHSSETFSKWLSFREKRETYEETFFNFLKDKEWDKQKMEAFIEEKQNEWMKE